MNKSERKILYHALKVVSTQFDILVGECMDANGKPQAPDRKALAKARGYLPPYTENAFVKTIPAKLKDETDD